MLLAIDTATRVASIALYDDRGVQAETTWRSRGNHTVELMAQIVRLLDLTQVPKSDLRAIGVALGPGSFTGLRVGMSVAKGLAYGSGLSLLGIPTLDAVAQAHAYQPLPIWAVLSAGRGRFSIAPYVAQDGSTRRVGEYALARGHELATLASKNGAGNKGRRSPRVLFCGEIDADLARTLADQLGSMAVIATPAMNARRAGFLAELAWARLMRDEADDLDSLAPMYTPYENQ